MTGADRFAELASRLEGIGEEVADLAIDEIREAIRGGGAKRPESEKRLTQARRAIDKAVHLLRTVPGTEPADDDDEF